MYLMYEFCCQFELHVKESKTKKTSLYVSRNIKGLSRLFIWTLYIILGAWGGIVVKALRY